MSTKLKDAVQVTAPPLTIDIYDALKQPFMSLREHLGDIKDEDGKVKFFVTRDLNGIGFYVERYGIEGRSVCAHVNIKNVLTFMADEVEKNLEKV